MNLMSCISCIKMKDVTLPRPLFKSAADNKSSGGQCCQEAAGWRPSDRQSQWFVRSHAGCNSPSNQTAVNTPRRAPTAGALHFSVQTAAQSEEACWYLYCLSVCLDLSSVSVTCQRMKVLFAVSHCATRTCNDPRSSLDSDHVTNQS